MNEQDAFKYTFSYDDLSLFESKNLYVLYRINSYRKLTRLITSAFYAEYIAIQAYCESEISRASSVEEKAQIDDIRRVELDYIKGDLSGIHYSSIFNSIMSFVEISMNKLCDEYKNRIGIKIGVTDLNNRGIVRAIKYLNKVANISPLENLADERKLLDLFEVRNQLVHSAMDWHQLRQPAVELLKKHVPDAIESSNVPGEQHLLRVKRHLWSAIVEEAARSAENFLVDVYKRCKKSHDLLGT